jgi:hypothetical protein
MSTDSITASSIIELADLVAARLDGDYWRVDAAHTAVAVRFVEEAHERKIPPPSGGTVGALFLKYAIRKDDLNLFDCIVDIAKTTAAAGFFVLPVGGSILSAKVGLVVAILKVARDLRNKSVALTDDQIRILTILRANVPDHTTPGMTVEDLLSVLRRTNPERDAAWVGRQLSDLARCPIPAGGMRELVSQDPRGRWRPHV